MSISREPLPLEPEPRSVQQARHWTSGVVRALGRHDLCEAAELGVSELVTNALLHAHPPISLRLRGTHNHPRIEVADGSPEPPVPPGPDTSASLDLEVPLPPESDLTADASRAEGAAADEAWVMDPALALSTLGRGLGIVSMCARAWGADIHEDGKVVWFEPVSNDAAGTPSRGAIFSQVDDLARTVPDEPLSPVVLQRVPLTLYAGFRQHLSELRRELRLLALAHENEYPLAANLGTLLTDFEAHLRHSDAAEAFGTPAADPAAGAGDSKGEQGGPTDGAASVTRDLSMMVPRSTPQIVHQMVDLLDLADAFCHAERLLSLARTPLQRKFQHWFLGELVRQAEGQPPIPWEGEEPAAGQSAS